ncbi:MAG: NFACT family protein [Lachnospiraceae bacterium]|nr:NFACT family protein [Lachnospiraceae bacterium]
MAFDGFTVAALVSECSAHITDARILKIAQTEKDELTLTLRCEEREGRNRQQKLVLSASSQQPLCYLTTAQKAAPASAPAFCMLLRKYLQNGRIVSVTQPGTERVIRFAVRHYDEMGDLRTYTLLIELMGKHSNIILTDESDKILDAIKHIPPSVSSVREVLPGRAYFLPDTQKKRNPAEVSDVVTLKNILTEKTAADIHQALYQRFTGISPQLSAELCYRAGVGPGAHPEEMSYEAYQSLLGALADVCKRMRERDFAPVIYYEAGKAKEYAPFPFLSFEERTDVFRAECMESMSELIVRFYAAKDAASRIKNKSSDVRQQVNTLLARAARKLDLQTAQLSDTEKKDTFRRYGELLTAYAHEIAPGAKRAQVTDYHTGQEVTIRLDETLDAGKNAQKYFDRYARMKRTAENLAVQIGQTKEEIGFLQGLQTELAIATEEADLAEIRRELAESGYTGKQKDGKQQRKGKNKKSAEKTPVSAPLHFTTTDGYDVYVGKTGYQNDALTFHGRGKNDWWFHAKQIPGSHVVLRADTKEIPDRAFVEAAQLAAYYSAGRENGRVEVDYTELKNVKKPGGGKPGFVVYYTNYSMVADADITFCTKNPESRATAP